MMEILPIDDVFNFEKGQLQSSKCISGKYDFITASVDWKTHQEYTHDCEAIIIAVAASGSLGRVHYVNGKFISSDLCFILTPKKKVNLRFYYYYFNFIREKLVKETATGTSKLAINRNNFKKFKIVYPEINTQNKLIKNMEFVSKQHEEYNLLQENNEKLISKLRQAILSEAVQGKLVSQDPNDEPASVLLKKIKAEKEKLIKEKKIRKEKPLPPITEEEIPYQLPEGWEWVKTIDICYQITDGAHHTPKYTEEGIPFISVKDMSKGYLNFSNTKFISKKTHQELIKRCHPEFEDVLLTKVGTTGIAKIIDIKKEFSIFVSVALLKYPTNLIFPKYFEHLLNSPLVKKYSKDGTEGVGNKNLVLRKIKSFIIPLPPLEEQKRIVAKVDQLMKLCDQLESQVQDNKKNAGGLMNAVLREAFEVSS